MEGWEWEEVVKVRSRLRYCGECAAYVDDC